MKIKEILSFTNNELNNIEESILKSKMLIMNVLNVSKEYLLIHDEDEFPESKKQELKSKILRLKKHEPIQYIINHQNFFGYDFYVDENVLIPQPDTEILVEETIDIIKEIQKKNKEELSILDLCTGSGAIVISLAKNIENSQFLASDISDKALNIARKNAINNNVENIKFVESDLFENIDKCFDLIVSNPPYIKTEVINILSEEVKKEPHIALDGGKDGLEFYRKIIKKSKEEVEKILEDNNYKNIYSKKDLGGNDRIIVAQF